MDEIKWKKISVESLRLTFNEGEKMLLETIQTSDIQNKRVLTIIKPVIGFITVLLGVVLSRGVVLDIAGVESLVALVILFYLFVRLAFIYKLYEVEPIGNNPTNILRQEAIDYAGKDLEAFLLFSRCQTIEDAININNQRNSDRVAKIAHVEKAIFWGVVVLLAIPIFWFVLQFLCVLG